jgi:hypothetical protein
VVLPAAVVAAEEVGGGRISAKDFVSINQFYILQLSTGQKSNFIK